MIKLENLVKTDNKRETELREKDLITQSYLDHKYIALKEGPSYIEKDKLYTRDLGPSARAEKERLKIAREKRRLKQKASLSFALPIYYSDEEIAELDYYREQEKKRAYEDYEKIEDLEIRPPLVWAGGKRAFVNNNLDEFLKPGDFNVYYEPFLGSGAALFKLRPTRAVVSDINEELINFYKILRKDPDGLIDELLYFVNNKNFYLEVRAWDRKMEYFTCPDVKRAARFYYINKMGYNGLYRLNRSGHCNTPYGHKKHEFRIDYYTLYVASQYLRKNNVKLIAGDYGEILKDVKKGDFIYFDPPSWGTQPSFKPFKFPKKELAILKCYVDILTRREAFVFVTCKDDEDVRGLFGDYSLVPYAGLRKMNTDIKARKGFADIMIKNY